VNIYIAHYHFKEISSALNALSVHLKQKWFKETLKRVQIECAIIQVRRETVPSWRASERECLSASCYKSVTRNNAHIPCIAACWEGSVIGELYVLVFLCLGDHQSPATRTAQKTWRDLARLAQTVSGKQWLIVRLQISVRLTVTDWSDGEALTTDMNVIEPQTDTDLCHRTETGQCCCIQSEDLMQPNGVFTRWSKHEANVLNIHCISKKASPTFSAVTWKPVIRLW